MPKFNKITHYCVIGAVLEGSRNSEELHTGSFFKALSLWGAFFGKREENGKMQLTE